MAAEFKIDAERKAAALLIGMEKAKGTAGQARESTDGSGGIIMRAPEKQYTDPIRPGRDQEPVKQVAARS